jgi:hypothetical protein
MQIRHSRWLMGKFVFLKGLAQTKPRKPRWVSGLSLSSVSIIAGGMKLVGHANVLDWRGDLSVWGLTGLRCDESSGKGQVARWSRG